MSDSMVDFSPSGPRETVLPALPEQLLTSLHSALDTPEGSRREALAGVAAAFPKYSEVWARMGEVARDQVEAYAYFRVGYHRGLDALRGAGWKGSGPVRWEQPSNRGFLRCLDGLRSSAAAIGESDEATRCEEFLDQCDPDRPHPLP